MVGISSPVFDLSGAAVLPYAYAEGAGNATRRVSRTATLDGGAVVTDTGYAVADNTLEIVANSALEADYAVLLRLTRLYSEVVVSTPDGVFTGSPSELKVDGTDVRLTVLVTEQLS